MAIKFDPTINLGHVLTFAGMLISCMLAYSMMDKRVAILEEARTSQSKIDVRQDFEVAEFKVTSREDVRSINGKLDAILMATQGAPTSYRSR